ncbi:hypothetical protein ACOV5J_00045 [Weissella soli]|jgi:hypothetical protein|uniref:hypothetical protein n=1 Tax=Weissella soli TaxID=155866 RepID=UPI003C789673
MYENGLTDKQFADVLAKNVAIDGIPMDIKFIKRLKDEVRLLPAKGSKWTKQQVENYLFELRFIKAEDIKW